jgi:galactose mutarotase-like enzyme
MTDAFEGIPQPPAERAERFPLPEILNVEVNQRSYDAPRVAYRERERIEHRQAVEIDVTTSSPIPARALSPVLYVGEEPVEDWETVGPNHYRFFAFEPERLPDNAPLAIAWPGQEESRREAAEPFRLDRPEPAA